MIADDEVIKYHERKYRKVIGEAKSLYDFGRRFLTEVDYPSIIDDDTKQLACHFCARGLTALRSLEILFVHGNETDAFSILRTLIELSVDMEFIWTQANRDLWVQRYVDGHWISDKDMKEALSRLYGRDYVLSLDDKHLALARRLSGDAAPFKDVESLRKWTRANHKRVKKQQHGWTSVSFKERTKHVKAGTFLYDVLYAMCSETSHSTMSTMVRFRIDGVRPMRIDASMLLELGGIFCGMMVLRAADHFGVLKDEAEAVFRAFGLVSRIPARLLPGGASDSSHARPVRTRPA